MKNWHHTLLGVFVGIALAAAIYLAASPPRGQSVVLQPAPTPAPLVVDVGGAVMRPGVYALPRDSRVQDAVDAAGGLSSQANRDGVNLAARLRDGEKIQVPDIRTPSTMAVPETTLPGRSPEIQLPSPAGLVNLNTATSEQLQSLPGVGPTRAEQIIAYREAHGGFKSIDEIQEIPGIGPVTFEKMKDLITID